MLNSIDKMNSSYKGVEIYNTYVQTIISNENRRQQASAIYISLTSAIFAFIASTNIDNIKLLIIPILIISVIWFFTIYYFKQLSEAKFKVIEEIEKSWEIKPFKLEWQLIDKKIPLTNLELLIPLIIFIGSLCFLLHYYFCKS